MAGLDAFDRLDFTDGGVTHHYYRRGAGPAVIVIPEVPGVTPKVIEFAERVVDAGFTVFMPSLFGIDGVGIRPDGIRGVGASIATSVGTLTKVCVSREFTILATGRSSRVVTWLRALARHAHAECRGPGVGAIGMCVSGGFALGMAVDDVMLAPVLSQPSLPLGVTPGRRRNIDISPADLACVRDRCAKQGLEVFGARFDGDMLVPGDRFAFLRDQLGDNFIGVELPDSAANPTALIPPHSVVTEHLIDEPGEPTRDTLDAIIAFFQRKLAA
ncbi:putative dienelactone hydrolase [Gordonia spumicola]|uniref:Putative dienelactone hydrolase n=1 Tax=Gordonia spumicola TaxID=589161 RepID=A0A7I9V9N6_9ACTN|nr:dienelactone hydrolase family protein [Gordonia spumicola]GEE02057.1 putative dienelactone hydrolase [Gordonia spumicola]